LITILVKRQRNPEVIDYLNKENEYQKNDCIPGISEGIVRGNESQD
jgi:hypothetical protein